MLFKPLSLPDDVCKCDETAILELLGDECDTGDPEALTYEPAWKRWFARQRELASQYEALSHRAGMRFSLDDIDTTLSPDQGLDDTRQRPISAEFVAYITVEILTNLELEAVSRSVEKSEPRPTSDDFTPGDDSKQIPAGPGTEGYDGEDARRRDTTREQCAAFPVTADELHSLVYFDNGVPTKSERQYKQDFLEGMGKCMAPSSDCLLYTSDAADE